ncbi:MAG TPA: carboxypeptidase-like regulatory domain-containing protein, partial [bacterium]|nr:carboxypeptidase-like regulatory domain-containing protein [bacterium]
MKREFPWLQTVVIAIIGVLNFLVFAGPTNLSAAVTGKIAGTVIDAETGEPLPGANIIVQGTSRGAAADEEGNYFILNVRPGTYAVEASMIGYERVTVTEVEVISGHTTTINFELNSAAIAGQEVVVEAQREVIKMDMSSSSISAGPDEVEEAPMVKDIGEFVSLQAGVGDNFRVRGGTTDETAFTVDGLTLVDNRSNEPLQIVNLSAIEEVSILKGGFNAEYGNIRSGLINVVTKQGTPDSYHGSMIFRYTPAYQKHRGRSLFDPQGYFLRPYMDPDVCWVGTNNGLWDEGMQEKYPYFRGWNAVASELNAAGHDITPEEARQRFMWLHRTWGADKLAPEGYDGLQREGRYGHTPDRFVDASFGGPVPVIGNSLGDLTFFASYSDNIEAFGLPTTRDNFREKNSQLKLTTRPTSNLNITIEGLYGEVNSVTRNAEGRSGGFVNGGDGIFWGGPATGGIEAYGGALSLYWPSAQNPFDVYRRMGGLSIDHNLSSSTYYSFHATYLS